MGNVLVELLRKPQFDLRLVVEGAAHRYDALCQGIQVTDQVDPGRWLRGNEIVLTTGQALRTPEALRHFVEVLHARECLALGFSGFEQDPPPALVEACREHGLPLFLPPYDLPLAELTDFVNRRLLEQHLQSLRSAVQLYRSIVGQVVSGAGVEEVTRTVGRELTKRDLAVLDIDGRCLALRATLGLLDDEVLEWVREHRRGAIAAGRSLTVTRADLSCDLVPVRLDSEVHAFIVVAGASALTEHEQLLVEQLHAGVVLSMARNLSERRTRRVAMSRLFEAVDRGDLSAALVEERMRAAALDPTVPAMLLRVSCARAPSEEHVLRALENELLSTAIGAYRGNAFVVCPELADAPASGLGARLVSALDAQGWSATVIGSLPHVGAEGFGRAYREVSTLAQQLNRPGYFAIETMDTISLLRSNQDEMIRLILERTLDPVIGHDRKHGTDLLATLERFLALGCRSGPAAEALHVHRHTITYRLNQIANLTGMDPRSGENLLEFTVALRLHNAGLGVRREPSD